MEGKKLGIGQIKEALFVGEGCESPEKPKWIYQLNQISFLLLCIFFCGLSFTGGGRYLEIGPFTPRLILFLLIGITAVPSFFYERKFQNPAFVFLIVFWAWVAISAVRGWNSPLSMRSVLISDIKGFAWFLLLPICLTVVNSKKRFSCLLNWILIGTGIQSIISLGLNIVCVVFPLPDLYVYLEYWMWGGIAQISTSVHRIFMDSGPYLVVSLAILVFRQSKEEKIRIRYVVLSCLYLNALLLSYTRSLYGAAGVAAIVSLAWAGFLNRKNWKTIVSWLGVTAATFLLFVCIQEISLCGSYINFAVARTFGTAYTTSYTERLGRNFQNGLLGKNTASHSISGNEQNGTTAADEKTETDLMNNDDIEGHQLPDSPSKDNYLEKEAENQTNCFLQTANQASDSIRSQTKAELKSLIEINPLFGNGLGAYAPCRQDGLSEYVYLDTIARMGVVGLILYFVPLLYVVYCLIRRMWQKKKLATTNVSEYVCVFGGLAGFIVATAFNPWMNAVLGIAWYSCCACVPQILESEK